MQVGIGVRVSRLAILWIGLGGLAAQAQLSTSAYRALGQPDLRKNALNMVQGAELYGPGGLALDASEGPLRLYIADTRNHRILAWQDARSFPLPASGQRGGTAALALGQPSLLQVGSLGIGAKGLSSPLGLAVDPLTGNLYVADFGNHRVLRFPKPFAPASRAEPDAVYGQPDFSSRSPNTGGISDHSMSSPRAVAFDSKGNLWVADSGNNRVLRFPASVLDSPNPAADLVVGQQDFMARSANQGRTVNSASFDTPTGVALDQQDSLYVSDGNNSRVLVFVLPLSTGQGATRVLGKPNFTSRGVPLQPSASTLASPAGLAMDRTTGDLHIAVPNDHRVMIFPSGAGAGSDAKKVLGQPNFTTNLPNANVAPQASAVTLSGVLDVKLDPDGNVFAADAGNHRVLFFPRGSPSATRVWGQTDLAANGVNEIKPSSLNTVYKMAIDYSESPYPLYVADADNHRVLVWKDAVRWQSGAPADLVIGQPDFFTALPNADSGTARTPSKTSLSAPKGLALDRRGDLYVADSGNNRVLRFPRPVSQSGRISPDLVIGQPDFTSSAAALATASSLKSPAGLAIGPDGNLFVADAGNNRVLEFRGGFGMLAAAVRVYGQPDFLSGTPPTAVSAQSLSNAQGLFVDGSFNLYVADWGANRVLVYPNTKDAPATGVSASIAIGQEDFSSAAPGAGAAHLRGPIDVAKDTNGKLYVSDSGNHRVLAFPSPIFLPIAGATATAVFGQPNLAANVPNWNGRDGLATAEGLSTPAGIFLDRRDTLYVGDTGNNRLVHVLKPAVAVHAAHFLATVPVAAGAVASLFGAGISEDTESAAALPLSASLAGRELVINDDIKAPLLFVSPDQVNFQVPSASPVGAQKAAVRVTETAELVAGGAILIASSSPGLFTLSQDGKGPGAVLNQDGTPNRPLNAAARGSVIQLFGTGQGPVSPTVADGQPAPEGVLAKTVATPTADANACLNSQPSVCVAIGAAFGEIQYSGLAPGFVGLWQLNVKIPQSAPTGVAIPVRAVIHGAPSNIVVMAIR